MGHKEPVLRLRCIVPGRARNQIPFNSLLLLNIYIYILSFNPVKLYSKHRPAYYPVPVALRLAVLVEIILTTVWGVLGLWMEEATFRYGITPPSC